MVTGANKVVAPPTTVLTANACYYIASAAICTVGVFLYQQGITCTCSCFATYTVWSWLYVVLIAT